MHRMRNEERGRAVGFLTSSEINLRDASEPLCNVLDLVNKIIILACKTNN